MDRIRGSFYGQVRRTAYMLWGGPDYVKNHDSTDFLGGPCLLRLAIRQRDSSNPQIEARAVYASLTDETQSSAILRAIYWDSRTVDRDNRHDPPEAAPFKIPARFVQMPVMLVQQWISRLNHLQTFLQIFPLQDDSLPICSLRIAIEPVYNRFEQTWQVIPGKRDALTHAWQEVWLEMEKVLQTYPTISRIKESFPCGEDKPEIYAFQAYEPLLNLP